MDPSGLRLDPVTFIREILINPETERPFVLYAEQEGFLREAFTPGPDGSLPYPEVVFSGPKKIGKTTTAALGTIYTVVALGGPYAEGYCIANDFEQAQGRVFQAISRIVQASPLLQARVTSNRIEFPSTGASITALASDYAGAAGANPTITVFDELWAYTSERSRRLWDEMVPVPTRKVSVRLTVTYAGFEGESELLEDLYRRGLKGDEIGPSLYRQPGLLMFWTHDPVAPWQTDEWLEQMRGQLRTNAYLRMIENRFVTSESGFVEIDWWDACADPETTPIVSDPELPVFVGVDASTKRDSTAIVACTYDGEKVRLVDHRIFQPTPAEPLDFDATIKETLFGMWSRFAVREIRYDPTQMFAVAQELRKGAGLPMVEFPQTVPNLTLAGNNLYDLIKGRNLVAYPDEALRLAVSRAIAVETTRGWRIAKEKASHRIDVVAALSFAALAVVQALSWTREPTHEELLREEREYVMENQISPF